MVFTPAVVVSGIAVENGEKAGTVQVSISVKNMSQEQAEGTLEVSIYELGKIVGGTRTMHTGVGSADVTFEAEPSTIGIANPAVITLRDFDDNKKWTFANPFMFEVSVRLGKNTVAQRFRICEITADENLGYVLLNGNPTFINALQIDKDTVEFAGDVATYLSAVKQRGINTVIATDTALEEIWYTQAEELGLLVFGEGEQPFDMTEVQEIPVRNFEKPTLATLGENATEDFCASVRASRKYCGVAL